VQADETLARSNGGIGVGLTLVKAIVERHGGQVSAHSDGPGKGSEFVVRLPLCKEEGGRTMDESDGRISQMASPSDPVQPYAPGQQACEVLLIEDDPDIRASLAMVLELDGFRVRAVGDGPAALEALRQACPDVMLIDVGLPGLDGYEVARRVRRECPDRNLRLIALTGYGQQSDKQAAQDAGFDHHLTKPVHYPDLAKLLSSVATCDGKNHCRGGAEVVE
jgi:CheY-like chemotaxis protein